MGELIRKVSELKIGNETFAVELNECTNDTGYKDIHIQNDKFRLNGATERIHADGCMRSAGTKAAQIN